MVGTEPRALILGSLPGEPSIRVNQYYANPRNAFWFIMGELLGFEPDLPYERRIDVVTNAGIALWDVLASAPRDGSLDSAIDSSGAVTNDFVRFFERHPSVRAVFLNGGTASDLFAKRVVPILGAGQEHVRVSLLPSSSPANTRLTRSEKLKEWRVILDVLGGT